MPDVFSLGLLEGAVAALRDGTLGKTACCFAVCRRGEGDVNVDAAAKKERRDAGCCRM